MITSNQSIQSDFYSEKNQGQGLVINCVPRVLMLKKAQEGVFAMLLRGKLCLRTCGASGSIEVGFGDGKSD